MRSRRRILHSCSLAVPALLVPRSIRAQSLLLSVESHKIPSFDPSVSLDGRSDAPSGTPQWPTLLDGYVARPPWQVAGVDYPVGPDSATSFVVPNAGNVPSGASYVGGDSPCISITGDNVVLENFDCTSIDNFQLQIHGNNAIVRNCKFKVINTSGLAQEPVKTWGLNFLFTKCLVDGSGLDMNGASTFTVGPGDNGSGGTITYCHFLNSFSQHVDGGLNGTLIMKFNLFENANAAAGPGVHGDWYEGPAGANGTMLNWVLNFNTAYQHQGGGTQGWMFEPGDGPGVTMSGECGYNTAVTAGPSGDQVNFIFGVGSPGNVILGWTVHDNYVDMTGGRVAPCYGFIRAIRANVTLTDNTDMTTGITVSARPPRGRTR
jgi:hypothetical protein